MHPKAFTRNILTLRYAKKKGGLHTSSMTGNENENYENDINIR